MAGFRFLTATWGLRVLWRSHHIAEAEILTQTSKVPSNKAKSAMTQGLVFQRAFSDRSIFRNERRPTEFDKKILLWTGRFKKKEDIPPLLSIEVLKAAQNQLRIRICYIMIALTLLGCVAMVIFGKQAAKRGDTLLKRNAEKKAKWRDEGQLEQELSAGKTE
ncbi:protein FAM162A-like [Eublepharis macularius]|uniref:Protein FAM162A-like n=1 Tax=Eublepharis macularius TaxID=481883 RepID=A0AA97LI82_EUBMA|nr:protein FAM162A-like [Eublepharis macularius]